MRGRGRCGKDRLSLLVGEGGVVLVSGDGVVLVLGSGVCAVAVAVVRASDDEATRGGHCSYSCCW